MFYDKNVKDESTSHHIHQRPIAFPSPSVLAMASLMKIKLPLPVQAPFIAPHTHRLPKDNSWSSSYHQGSSSDVSWHCNKSSGGSIGDKTNKNTILLKSRLTYLLPHPWDEKIDRRQSYFWLTCLFGIYKNSRKIQNRYQSLDFFNAIDHRGYFIFLKRINLQKLT